MDEMGQTGAGLTSEDMILAGTPLASKWGMLAIVTNTSVIETY